MPAKDFLSIEQKTRLQQELKANQDAGIRERILILLLMNDGKTQREISNFVGCSLRTVAYWCVHGDPDDLESLIDRRKYGNYQKATDEYINLLLETVEREPSELGYEFGRWTGERLASYLAEQTGIKLSGSQVRKILKRKKYRYLWAKYSLEDKQNPEKRTEFKDQLERHLARSKEDPEGYQVWFWDESGFSLRVIRRKQWGKKGNRKKLTGQRRRGRVNVMGGLRFSDRKRVCYFIDKGNGDSFYEQLKALNEFVKREWVERGNRVEEYEAKGPKIILILDNASYHKREDILAKIGSELKNIVLEFLSAYSPDFNLIEVVWHSCKEYIAHKLFKSVDELKDLLKRLLNDGELIIQWGRRIKNKGNAVNAN